jgi:hypothetical protein
LEDELTEKKELIAKYIGKIEEWDAALGLLSNS